MRILLFALLAWLLSDQPVPAQSCTPQIVQQLQQRGVNSEVIATMCGGGASGVVGGATMCATPVGACPFHGAVNVPCSCTGQFGTIQGQSR